MTDKKTDRAALDGIDIRLGDLFGDLGAALTEMIERLDAGTDGEVRRVHEFDTARGPIRAQAGIRIRMGGIEAGRGGRDPSRPTAAEPPRAAAPPGRAPARPIHADIVDDGEIWSLTADLAGVAQEDLALSIAEGELVIAAEARNRRYADRVPVPPGTEVAHLRISLQNGILEIEAPSAAGARP
jgi:HSP20 family molecular chaperone IbpA